VCTKLPLESESERILQIGVHLRTLRSKVKCIVFDSQCKAYYYLRPCVAKKLPQNRDIYQIFKFGGSCTQPFPQLGQIWHETVDPRCTIPCQIAPSSVNIVARVRSEIANLTNFVIIEGLLFPPSLTNQGQIWP